MKDVSWYKLKVNKIERQIKGLQDKLDTYKLLLEEAKKYRKEYMKEYQQKKRNEDDE